MHCKKCGKKIDDEFECVSDYCRDCMTGFLHRF
jgi:predicted nucleic acid-binding Zn ribbon protein